MNAKKWNTKTKEYEDYKLPDGAISYTDDLDSVISCAACGKAVTAGDTYTSLEIHTDHGFGFLVCGECYNEELKRKFENK